MVTRQKRIPPRALILDLDGTLVDTESIAARTWAQTGVDLGITIPPEMVAEMTGRRYEDLAAIANKWLGEEIDGHTLLDAANLHYHRMTVEEVPDLMPGTIELLEAAKKQRVTCIVATSSQLPNAQQKLRATGLSEYVVDVLSGDDVPEGKPAPDIFLAAAKQLKLPPSVCMTVEDSGPGIIGARAAGTSAVLIPDQAEVTGAMMEAADYILESLHDVISLLS